MSTSRMTEKGQITIPKLLRNRLGLHPGDEVELREVKDGIRVQKKASPTRFAKYRGFLKLLKGKTSDELIEDMRGQ